MHKNWCFTSYDEKRPELEGKCRWYVVQREQCPSSGRLHWQGVCGFDVRKRFDTVKRVFSDDSHLEPCRSVESSVQYCSKEETRVGDVFKYGPVPTGRSILQRVREDGVRRVLEDSPNKFRWIRHLANLRAMFIEPRSSLTVAYWLWGEPGCGKSKYAHQLSGEFGRPYWKDLTPWWCGYENEPYVIIDDVRSEFSANFILRLIDRYPFKVQVKGGYAEFTSSVVVFTSNVSMREAFFNTDELTYKALLRRVIEIPL